jgi:peptidoglycan/LPS O-acetylase OafA/YrhL
LLATKALAFLMTVALALASYRWIESPFLRLKDRFATVLSRPV